MVAEALLEVDETLARSRYLWLYAQERLPHKHQERFAALRAMNLKTGQRLGDQGEPARVLENAVAEGLNSKIQTIRKAAYGLRSFENFKTAIFFHCGGLGSIR